MSTFNFSIGSATGSSPATEQAIGTSTGSSAAGTPNAVTSAQPGTDAPLASSEVSLADASLAATPRESCQAEMLALVDKALLGGRHELTGLWRHLGQIEGTEHVVSEGINNAAAAICQHVKERVAVSFSDMKQHAEHQPLRLKPDVICELAWQLGNRAPATRLPLYYSAAKLARKNGDSDAEVTALALVCEHEPAGEIFNSIQAHIYKLCSKTKGVPSNAVILAQFRLLGVQSARVDLTRKGQVRGLALACGETYAQNRIACDRSLQNIGRDFERNLAQGHSSGIAHDSPILILKTVLGIAELTYLPQLWDLADLMVNLAARGIERGQPQNCTTQQFLIAALKHVKALNHFERLSSDILDPSKAASVTKYIDLMHAQINAALPVLEALGEKPVRSGSLADALGFNLCEMLSKLYHASGSPLSNPSAKTTEQLNELLRKLQLSDAYAYKASVELKQTHDDDLVTQYADVTEDLDNMSKRLCD